MESLENLPPTYNSYDWADYIELLCLASVDGRVTKNDVLDLVRERARDLKEGKPIEGSEADDDELESDIEQQLGIEKPDNEEDIDEETTDPAVANDKWDKRANDWFKNLEYRAGSFGLAYPFEVLKGGSVLALANSKGRLELRKKNYIFLLLAANLRYFSKKQQTDIASVFEVVSFYALQNYLPGNSVAYMFGKHGNNSGSRYSSGTLWQKLNLLAEDIREEVLVKQGSFKPSNTGDAGLDLVAWVPLEDNPMRRGFFLVFGQCACTPKWVGKQFETHYDTWKNYLSFTVFPLRLTFIPYCFRQVSGAWYDHTKISATILIDRLRLIHLLEGKLSLIRPYISSHIDDFLRRTSTVV